VERTRDNAQVWAAALTDERAAVEWEVIERMPCSITLLPVPKGSIAFHDFDEFERLVEAARLLDARTHLVVLLGGEAGLRCGEMMALEWSDVDLVNRQVCIRRSDWRRPRVGGSGTCRSPDDWRRR
jgi:integrase